MPSAGAAVEFGAGPAGSRTRRARTVAFDLIRHDLLMTLKAVPRAEIVAIVDQIFLPLMGVAVPDHTDEEPFEAGR